MIKYKITEVESVPNDLTLSEDEDKEMEIYNHVKQCTNKICKICESSYDFIDVKQTKIRQCQDEIEKAIKEILKKRNVKADIDMFEEDEYSDEDILFFHINFHIQR